MNKKNLAILALLLLTTAADLILAYGGDAGRLATKPLLMPLLMLLYTRETEGGGPIRRIFLTALFFSWLGDVLLLFEDRDLA